MAMVAAACGDPEGPQVLVFLEAEPGALEGAETVSVRACREQDAPACTGGYAEDRPLAATPSPIPGRIPVGPPSNGTEAFWLEARLLDAGGAELNTLRATAGFANETRSLRLRFTDACRGVVCAADKTCLEGSCVDACYEPAPTATEDSVPVPCQGGTDAGVPTDAGTPCDCPCEGDVCDGDDICRPARPIDRVAAGRTHTCVGAAGDSAVWCWGENRYGQVGAGEAAKGTLILEPTRIGLGASLSAVIAGNEHTCAVLDSGEMQCWGWNNRRRLGIDGSEIAEPTLVSIPSEGLWSSASLFNQHTCALTTRGDLYCWGAATLGRTGLFDPPYPNEQPVPMRVERGGWTGTTVGGAFSCGLRSGSVECWGSNSRGQIAQPEMVEESARPVRVDVPRTVQIAAGNEHVCAVLSTGLVRCWGRGSSGRLGNGARPGSQFEPVDVSPPDGADQAVRFETIQLGQSHTCGVSVDGQLFCWGFNFWGQLGLGEANRADRAVPTRVVGEQRWTAVTAGTNHTCAIDQDGSIHCWGEGRAGQLSESCRGDSRGVPCRVCLPP